jgi:putative PEP-CTERM system TPR-repeat lipoprotein
MIRKSVRYALVGVVLAAWVAGCGGQKPEALVASGKEYLAKNDVSAAVIQLRNALQKDPDLPEARFLLGKALLKTGDIPGAEKELRQAADLQYPQDEVAPLWARALVLTGQFKKVVDELAKVEVSDPHGKAELMTAVGDSHLALKNPDAARDAYAAAVAADPKFVPAIRGQARLAGLAGDEKETAAKLDEALTIAPEDPETLELKARLMLARKESDQALALYRKAVAAKPDMLGAHAAIVSILMQKKEVDEAAKQVAAMKRVAPNHPQTLYLQAWVALRKNDLPTARAAIQEHLKVAPENPLGLLLAAAIEYELQSYGMAEQYSSQVLAVAPRHPLAWRLLVNSYLRTGQPNRALERLQPVLGQFSNNPAMLTLAGEVFMANGDPKRAGDYFAKAAAIDPKNAQSRTGLALTHLAQGESETGIRELEQVVSSGSDLRADFMLISAYVRQRQFDKALAEVDRVEKKQPNTALVANVRGGVLLVKGDVDRARKEFERALQIDPGYYPAAAQLTRLDLQAKKPDAARQRLEAVIAKDPKNAAALLALAELKRREGGNPKDVAALVQKAVAAQPTDPAPRIALIRYYAETKDFKSAMAAANEAMAALPNRTEILEVAGAVHEAAGENNQALSIYQKFATLQPKSPVPLLHMASAQAANNNNDDAVESLQKALELKPDLLEAQRALILMHLKADRVNDALAIAREVQKQRPKEAAGQALEGDIYAAKQRWADAATAYRAAFKVSRTTDVAVRLHSALARAGSADADRFAAEWMKEQPKDAAFRIYLAQAASARGDYARAAQYYREMLDKDPKNVIVLNNLAWTERELKDPKAVEHAELALKLAPNQPAIMDTLGWIYVERGDVARGVQLLQNAVALEPRAAAIRLNLAKALLQAGDKSGAKKELQELEKLGDKFPAQAEVAKLKQSL